MLLVGCRAKSWGAKATERRGKLLRCSQQKAISKETKERGRERLEGAGGDRKKLKKSLGSDFGQKKNTSGTNKNPPRK